MTRGYPSLWCVGFSLQWFLSLLSTGFSCYGSWAWDLAGFSSCGPWAQLLQAMWNLSRSGIEPVSPALVGGFFTTEPPGKLLWFLKKATQILGAACSLCHILVTTLWCICLVCLTLTVTNLHWKLTARTQGILLDLPRNLILLYLKLVSAFSVLYPLCSLIFLLAFDVFLSVSLFLLQFLRFLTCWFFYIS